MMRSASSTRPAARASAGFPAVRGESTTRTARAPISTTQRQPSRPNGACGTSRYARNATTGTATNPTACSHANARPRICFGTSSEMYVPIVTISTPRPRPTTKRQKFSPAAVSWNAITTLAAVYHSSDHVKIARRPKRSARKPQAIVPMKPGEQRGDEARDARGAEQAVRRRRQDSAFHEAGGDVAAIEQVVEPKKKPRLSRTTSFQTVRVGGRRSRRAEMEPGSIAATRVAPLRRAGRAGWMPWWQVSGFLIVLALPEGRWRAASRILARRAAEHISHLTRGRAPQRIGAALIKPVPPSLAIGAQRHTGFTAGQSTLSASRNSTPLMPRLMASS